MNGSCQMPHADLKPYTFIAVQRMIKRPCILCVQVLWTPWGACNSSLKHALKLHWTLKDLKDQLTLKRVFVPCTFFGTCICYVAPDFMIHLLLYKGEVSASPGQARHVHIHVSMYINMYICTSCYIREAARDHVKGPRPALHSVPPEWLAG